MGLLEVLLSLFIAGIIAAGAVLLYGMASDRRMPNGRLRR